MITTFCYYPAWQKLPAERRTLFRTDQMEGVSVHRCWHYVPAKATTVRRIFHELSFVATSFLRQLFLPKADLIVVISPPLLLGAAAWVLSRLKGSRYTFHVHDIQPDAAAGLGMLKESALLNALRWLEKVAYEKAVFVSGITPGMLHNFCGKGVPAEKCVYFPNGIYLPDFWRIPKRGAWRASNGFSEADFLVVYSGNIGRKQGLDMLLRAAGMVKDPAIRFVLCGDGAEAANLRRLAAELALPNVTFLPLQVQPAYHQMLVDSDLSVIPQRSGTGDCFFPSKLLATLAFGSPILAVTDPGTELARALNEGGFGTAVPPGDPGRIAEALDRISAKREDLREMGRAGAKFVKRFEMESILEQFKDRLVAAVPAVPKS
jgi:colanic acid biosynthesis glycosyl transferase WcaI